jgi:hypothetical protein
MAITRLGGANAITGTIPTSVAPGQGKVLQVVSNSTRYYQIFGSTSFTDMEDFSSVIFETSITPSSSSNKIFILPSISCRGYDSGAEDARFSLRTLAKIGSGSYNEITLNNQLGGYDYGSSGLIVSGVVSNNILYAPNTTNEVTVKFQLAQNVNTVNVNTNPPSGTNTYSSVTLMEIEA